MKKMVEQASKKIKNVNSQRNVKLTNKVQKSKRHQKKMNI